MQTLQDFCFAHEDLFLVPAEELSARGLSADYAALLERRGLASAGWLELFGHAYALYWQRAQELAERAPGHWLPPRALNVCVARDPVRVRPYFQPLGRASCLVDHQLFEPESTSLELAAYQFFHLERLGLLRQVVPALLADLSYWLVRTSAERARFAAGCRRVRAGARAGWRALGDAMEWIPRLGHRVLKPLPAALTARELAPGGVLVPASCEGELERLVRAFGAAALERTRAYFAARAGRTGAEPAALAEWLRRERPHLLVTGKGGEILWDLEAPERTDRIEAELAGASADAAESLRADWGVVSERSRAYLASLQRPDELPRPGPQIDQDGLAYVHRERRLIAYNLREPGMRRLEEPAPAFERWMLAARTIHEWGHLAVDAGHVPVPPARRAEFLAAQGELAELLTATALDAPGALRAHAAAELARLEGRGGIGPALVAGLLERVSDYQSNLLAQRYLTRAERETYVRNNVRPLVGEVRSQDLFQTLVRYAFEHQYLAFSAVADARAYFLATTWFGQQFLRRGVLTEARLDALLALVARICRCHEVDLSRYREPAAGEQPALATP